MLNDLKLPLIESTDAIIFYSAPALGNFQTSGKRDKLFKKGLHQQFCWSLISNHGLAANIRNQRTQNPLSPPPTEMLLCRQLTQFNSALIILFSAWHHAQHDSPSSKLSSQALPAYGVKPRQMTKSIDVKNKTRFVLDGIICNLQLFGNQYKGSIQD